MFPVLTILMIISLKDKLKSKMIILLIGYNAKMLRNKFILHFCDVFPFDFQGFFVMTGPANIQANEARGI